MPPPTLLRPKVPLGARRCVRPLARRLYRAERPLRPWPALLLSSLLGATACGPRAPAPLAPLDFTALTFNAGTTPGLDHDRGEATGEGDGYTQAMADIADAYYENSLSWNPAEAALTAFLAEKRPAIAAFQEIFHDPWCEEIPAHPDLDFVCKDYTPDRPWQIQRLLGEGYTYLCAVGQPDNCAGVRTDFGTVRGCAPGTLCPEGLQGHPPPDGCSRGARMSKAVVDRADGRTLTLVVVHGTSGFSEEDMACRRAQFEQVFVDAGDGRPLADGEVNLILGDFNTDPIRMAGDPSADFVADHVGPGRRFHFVSPAGREAPATYAGIATIDYLISDRLEGSCIVPGVGEEPPVMDAIYWDHLPVLCQLRWR